LVLNTNSILLVLYGFEVVIVGSAVLQAWLGLMPVLALDAIGVGPACLIEATGTVKLVKSLAG
jgi:hypothetical protein